MSDERGQASVELVAALPLVLVAAALAWQVTLAGHALWLCAHAARAAARADSVGASARAAARSAVPESMASGLRVERLRTGGVRVSLRVPAVLGGARTPFSVSASSSLGRGS
ncbi:MAG: hypothetical protein JW895_03075 [Thermoleophilaceae bacterium]|nr:hypothetical protein [Thermoleophilaceae bacterium]